MKKVHQVLGKSALYVFISIIISISLGRQLLIGLSVRNICKRYLCKIILFRMRLRSYWAKAFCPHMNLNIEKEPFVTETVRPQRRSALLGSHLLRIDVLI